MEKARKEVLEFIKIVKAFNAVLKGTPKSLEELEGAYIFFIKKLGSIENFKSAIYLWAEDHDMFPTHIELYKFVKPTLFKWGFEIYTSSKNDPEKYAIKQILYRDYLAGVPEVGDYEWRTATPHLMDRYSQRMHDALDRFYKDCNDRGYYDVAGIQAGSPEQRIEQKIMGIEGSNVNAICTKP